MAERSNMSKRVHAVAPHANAHAAVDEAACPFAVLLPFGDLAPSALAAAAVGGG